MSIDVWFINFQTFLFPETCSLLLASLELATSGWSQTLILSVSGSHIRITGVLSLTWPGLITLKCCTLVSCFAGESQPLASTFIFFLVFSYSGCLSSKLSGKTILKYEHHPCCVDFVAQLHIFSIYLLLFYHGFSRSQLLIASLKISRRRPFSETFTSH